MTIRLLGRGVMLTAALLAAPSALAQLRVSAERISDLSVDVRDVSLSVHWPPGQSDGELELKAASMALKAPELRFESVLWRCPLLKTEQGWRCRGTLAAHGVANSQLTLELFEERVSADFSQAKARLSLSRALVDDAAIKVVAQRLPVSWLQPLLAGVWQDATLTSGRLDFDGALQSTAQGGALQGKLGADELGLDTTDGSIAAAGLKFAGAIDLGLHDATTVGLDLNLSGGEILAGSFYAELPSSPVGFTLDATSIAATGDDQAAAAWRIRSASMSDANTLKLSANGRIDPTAASALTEASIRLQSEDLANLTSRYAQSLLAAVGLPGLTAKGGLSADLELVNGAAERIRMQWRETDIDSGDQRFAFDGLVGTLGYSANSNPEPSQLKWQSARLYNIDLGAAEWAASSVDGSVRLTRPLTLATLGGEIQLQRLGWSPAGIPSRSSRDAEASANDSLPVDSNSESGNQLQLALALEGLDLAALSKAFDWPAFTGTLSGTLPGVTYARETLMLDGGLSATVFDGSIAVDKLSVERPLGVAPTLTASVALNELDLQPLTAAFGFGEIEGRLKGRIDGLRMVDWSPAAFDARFETVERKGVRRRISQRAVNDLSSVGGGPVAGLQAQLLGVFDSFGYRRIGLGCRLANNICLMSGIEGLSGTSGSGYTIVEGSGLPSITVNGFQRRVDWPVLVSRLRAISDGQSLRIE